MTVKSVIPALILVLLFFVSGCKKENTPEPQSVRISYIQPLGELEYEGDLLTLIGSSKLSYDHQQRLRTIVSSQVDTVDKWFEGEKYLYTYGSYLQYGFAWEGSVVQGIKIDSTATQTSVNGIIVSGTYSVNNPQVSFFHTGNRLDSIVAHSSLLNGHHRVILEYDDKNRIIRRISSGKTFYPPYQVSVPYIQVDSSFEYDDYNNPYHLLHRQLGTLLPELILENVSPNNPIKYTTHYKDGTTERSYETHYSYTYNAQRYPTQIVTTVGSSPANTKMLRYE